MSLKSNETSYCEFLITTRSPRAVTVSWHLGELSGRGMSKSTGLQVSVCSSYELCRHTQTVFHWICYQWSEAKQMCYKHSCNKLLYLMMTTLTPN